jgi:hypothetical protein
VAVLAGDLVISGMYFMAEKDWLLRAALKNPASSNFTKIKIGYSKDGD